MRLLVFCLCVQVPNLSIYLNALLAFTRHPSQTVNLLGMLDKKPKCYLLRSELLLIIFLHFLPI